jgi:putative addiction module component (TIGR02574 family)
VPTSLKDLLEQACALSAEDRAKLIESLLESLNSPLSEIEKAWAEEIEQRIAAFDRGEISAYSVEDVFADARRISR